MMIEPKIIKTNEQYRANLAEVERLAADDPAPGTPDGDRLELLEDVREAEKQLARGRGVPHSRAKAQVLARLAS